MYWIWTNLRSILASNVLSKIWNGFSVLINAHVLYYDVFHESSIWLFSGYHAVFIALCSWFLIICGWKDLSKLQRLVVATCKLSKLKFNIRLCTQVYTYMITYYLCKYFVATAVFVRGVYLCDMVCCLLSKMWWWTLRCGEKSITSF